MGKVLEIGTVFAIVGAEAHRFTVNVADISETQEGFNRDIKYLYRFFEPDVPTRKQALRVSATDDLVWRVRDEIGSSPGTIHCNIIRLFLLKLNGGAVGDDIILTTEDFDHLRSEPSLSASELGRNILNFVLQVNNSWPAEGISITDLKYSYPHRESDLSSWLERHRKAGFFATGPNKSHPIAGATENTYRINFSRQLEIEQYLRIGRQPSTDDSYRLYKVVDIQPDALPGGFAFCMTEFRDPCLSRFQNVIKPTLKEDFAIDIVTSLEDSTPTSITDIVISHIHKCRFAIADISSRNLNVLYEIGFAHAINKNVLIICDRQAMNPHAFDIRNINTLFFDNDEHLRDQLKKRVPRLVTD